MNRKKLFIENIFSYGLIGILDRIIPFLLLPVITRLMPNTSEYGMFTMFTTIVGFGTPLAVLGLYDAMFREYFEKDDLNYRYNVTHTTQKLILFSSLIICTILIIFSTQFSSLFFGNSNHSDIVMYSSIAIFVGANKTPIQGPTRLQNQRKIYAITGILSSIINYGLSIFFIYLGYSYYGLIFANIIATIIILLFFFNRNKDFFLQGSFNFDLAKELLKIGLPLLPTFLIYWIYNSMDRIMIVNMLGIEELGIYSIGSKTAQISQIIYAGFAGGFSYFKYKTMKDSDQVHMNSKLFEYAFLIANGAFIAIYPFSKVIFEWIYNDTYVNGYTVFPYLFFSPLLLMSFQIVASQFIIVKKSYLSTLSLFIGACVNVLLNWLLIPSIGIEGAAIATMLGYITSIIIVMIVAKHYNLLIIPIKLLIVILLTTMYFIFNKFVFQNNLLIGIACSFICIGTLLILYFKEIKTVFFGVR